MTDEGSAPSAEAFVADVTPAEMKAAIRCAYGPRPRQVHFADVVSCIKFLIRWSLFGSAVFAFYVLSDGWRHEIQQTFYTNFAALSIGMLVDAVFKGAVLVLVAIPGLAWALYRARKDYKAWVHCE